MPRAGVWHADLHVDTEKPDTGSITLKAEQGFEFRGTIVRGDAWNGSVWLRIVGGAGGLGTKVTSKFYKSVPLRLPLSDLLSDAKETLSRTSDDRVLEQEFATWSRFAGPTYVALQLLVGSAVWRILPDGSVWVGDESWPSMDLQFDLLEHDPTRGRSVIATEAITLVPGVLLQGRRVSRVVHRVEPRSIRTEVFYEQ